MLFTTHLKLRQLPFVRTCAGLAAIAAFAAASTVQADHHNEQTDRTAPMAVTAQDQPAAPPTRDTRDQRRRAAPDQAASLRGQRVAILVGDDFHDGETFMPMAYLANRGAIITVIGIESGELEAYNSDMTIRVERSVNEVSFRQFDALILPGGKGPSVLRENEDVVSFARDFFESGRPVAAICHGPQVLATAGVLEGKTATCIADISSEIKEAGAEYKDEAVVRDGNLITSRIPDDIPAFCKKIEKVMIEMAEQRRQERRPAAPDQPGRIPSR